MNRLARDLDVPEADLRRAFAIGPGTFLLVLVLIVLATAYATGAPA